MLAVALAALVLSACGGGSETSPTSTVAVEAAPAGPIAAADIPTGPATAGAPGRSGLPGIQPQAAGFGAPPWVGPGTRVTFYNAAASVPLSRYQFVEDPNGNWIDDKSGKRYRRTDETAEGQPGASGDGFFEIDVIAADGADVIVNQSRYVIDHINNQVTWAPAGGGRRPAAAMDGAWVHPGLLAQLQNQGLGGMLVLRGPYQLGATVHEAVGFVTTTPGAYQSYTYDTATGVLLASTTSTQGAGSPVRAVGEPAPQGNTLLTITRLAGVRQRAVPGLNGTNPPWVGATSELRYSGTYNFTNPIDPTSANFTHPLRLSVGLGDGGADWRTIATCTVIDFPGSPEVTDLTGVSGSSGLYWIDPAALAVLAPGQVLDVDPVTGARTTVASRQPWAGGELVTIVTELSGVTVSAGYDQASGALAIFDWFEAATGTTVRLQLESGP